ncbi:MAG: hypothetical protein MJ204_00020 [Bacteroidales bacterium]|nr:hypothetical protein [Bacteroidales bacterium]
MEVFGKQMEVFVPELTKKWKVNGIKMEVWYNSIESATKTKKPANALITALCERKTHKRKRTILFSAYKGGVKKKTIVAEFTEQLIVFFSRPQVIFSEAGVRRGSLVLS